MFVTSRYRTLVRRLGYAALAFFVTDLLLAFSVFSVATLGILRAFALAWIELASECSAHSMAFGTTDQLQSAQAILVVAPIFMAVVVFLAVRALRIPRRLWQMARGPVARPSTPGTAVTVVPPPTPLPPMSEGALWAVRGPRPTGEYHNMSLLIGQSP